jgi:aspartate/tyrosine/aromatic aminotransferase
MDTCSTNTSKPQSRFSKVPSAPYNKMFSTKEKFEKSTNNNKMNLSLGMLYDEEGKLISFSSVEQSEKMILDLNMNKEYPPITGMPEFCSAIQNLFFPQDSDVVKEGRILTAHTITGGAALRVCAEVINRFLPKKIHLSNLTFLPYKNIFTNLEICYYPYYNSETKSLDVDAFLEYLYKIENNSIICLQLSSHNPTALDFDKESWDRICEVMKNKSHLALFDAAYLGYGNGDICSDLYPIHKFAENKIEMFICYSSAKNFANYSDDVGALMVVMNKKEPVMKLKTHLVVINRSLFSFVSLYGSRVIERILNTNLKQVWLEDQKSVYKRITELRSEIISEIEKEGVNININFLKSQKGIYIFLDLNENQVDRLAEEFGIFLCDNGRLNISGMKKHQIAYFVQSLKTVLN